MRKPKRKKYSTPSAPELIARPLLTPPVFPAPPAPPIPSDPARVTPITRSRRQTSLNADSIRNYQELIAALQARKVQITLANDIFVKDNILINHDVAINFNGHCVVADESLPAARVFDVRSGEVSLIGKGKIFAMGKDSVALRLFGAISSGLASYTAVTVGEEISLFAPDSYAIMISPNLGAAYGLSLDFAGGIIAHDGINFSSEIRGRQGSNLPTINLISSARITVDEESGIALAGRGFGVWHVNGARLRGAKCGVFQSGKIDFSYAEATSSCPSESPVFEFLDGAATDLEFTLDGGLYISENGCVFAGQPSSLKSLTVKGGDFRSLNGVLAPELKSQAAFSSGIFDHKTLDVLAHFDPSLPRLPEPSPIVPPSVLDLPPVSNGTEVSQFVLPTSSSQVQSSTSPSRSDPESTPSEATSAEAAETLDESQAEVAERAATCAALSEALADLKELHASDYEGEGFATLTDAIAHAESVIADEQADLVSIRDVASELLAAFDNLSEADDISLSDSELDQLFYHGAVLSEVADPAPKKPKRISRFLRRAIKQPKPARSPKSTKSSRSTNSSRSVEPPKKSPRSPEASKTPKVVELSRPSQPSQAFQSPQPSLSLRPAMFPCPINPPIAPPAVIPPLSSSVPAPSSRPRQPEPNFAEPDLDNLRKVIATIADLDPSVYQPDGYNAVLRELTRVQSAISAPVVTQGIVDQLTLNLCDKVSALVEIAPTPPPAPSVGSYFAGPYPSMSTYSRPAPSAADSPAAFAPGKSCLIDEMTPFERTAYPEENSAISPADDHNLPGRSHFAHFARNFLIGARAGLDAYRRSRDSQDLHDSPAS